MTQGGQMIILSNPSGSMKVKMGACGLLGAKRNAKFGVQGMANGGNPVLFHLF
jgi:hypothetical protein